MCVHLCVSGSGAATDATTNQHCTSWECTTCTVGVCDEAPYWQMIVGTKDSPDSDGKVAWEASCTVCSLFAMASCKLVCNQADMDSRLCTFSACNHVPNHSLIAHSSIRYTYRASSLNPTEGLIRCTGSQNTMQPQSHIRLVSTAGRVCYA